MNGFDPEKTAAQSTAFIKATLGKAGFAKAVIGVSAGVDSATVLFLLTQALGEGNIFPLILPYGALNTQATLEAMALIQSRQIPLSNITRIDIKPAVDRVVDSSGPTDRVRKGNIMARIRMIYLFDQAKKRGALVAGTENRTEHLLGYFTRFGDEASDIEPIRHLYKTQVLELARFLKVPEHTVARSPSAELWPGQTDESELGFTYQEADRILSLVHDEKQSAQDVVAAGFPQKNVEKVLKRVTENEYKHVLPHLFEGE